MQKIFAIIFTLSLACNFLHQEGLAVTSADAAEQAPKNSIGVDIKLAKSVKFIPDKLQKIYMEECKKCHGATGKGDGPLANYLKTRPANLTNPELWQKSGNLWPDIICNGKPPMPPHKEILKEQGCREMADFIRTLGPAPSEKE